MKGDLKSRLTVLEEAIASSGATGITRAYLCVDGSFDTGKTVSKPPPSDSALPSQELQ